jgi:hypothetical protein
LQPLDLVGIRTALRIQVGFSPHRVTRQRLSKLGGQQLCWRPLVGDLGGSRSNQRLNPSAQSLKRVKISLWIKIRAAEDVGVLLDNAGQGHLEPCRETPILRLRHPR